MNCTMIGFLLVGLMGLPGATLWAGDVVITGERMVWHPVTLSFEGPETSEQASPNPFLDYRMTVVFTQAGRSIAVPGYYAANGYAGNTSADRGSVWRVHFMPDAPGNWNYWVSFRTGRDIAISPEPFEGRAVAFDGTTGSLTITESDKVAPDFRARGLLQYTGERYLRFAGTGEAFLKGGADSPENFLAYADFDGTYRHGSDHTGLRSGEASADTLHQYEPHRADWQDGDPTWKIGKGKAMIGALNYLASEEMNSVYFLTMNIAGDGKDVWPYISHTDRFRFDCSKLDQWEIVFRHMTRLGLTLHVITQETENDQLLDGGVLGKERKLYYRELIARFSHHPALVWNLGEENTNTSEQIRSFSEYIHRVDPYDHPIVIHTYPGQYDKVYNPLLGFPFFEGPSLQMGTMKKTHSETLKWVHRSLEHHRQWFVSLDEIGPADTGVKPDTDDPEHNDVRIHALWGNLMAGGAGCEWYFGYKYAHNDLNCEDWRSRDIMWDQTRYALQFFETIPFTEMMPADELLSHSNAYAMAASDGVYAVYLWEKDSVTLQVDPGRYRIERFNPRTGETTYRETERVRDDEGLLLSAPEEQGIDWAFRITGRNR